MNTIVEMQNTDESILLLASQRVIYSSAKNILRIKEVLVVIIPIVISLLYTIITSCKAYFQLYSFAILFIDMIFLEHIIAERKKKAALIQELFDSKVLELNKSIIKYDYPTRSEIELSAKKIKMSKD